MHKYLLCTIGLLAACGNDNTTASSDPLTGCKTYYNAFRTAVGACPGGVEAQAGFSDDVVTALCTSLAAKVTAGSIHYDGSQLAPCISAAQSIGCVLRNPVEPAACRMLFTGTVAAGGPCDLTPECASGGTCQLSHDGMGNAICPGVCVARAAAGAPCTTASDCQSGLTCPGTVCADQPVAVGGTCASSGDCASSAYCSFAGGTGPGMCQPLIADGQPCLGNEKYQCMPGSGCTGGSPSVCTPLVADGGMCTGDTSCKSQACIKNVCQTLTTVGLGQPCGVITGGIAFCNQGFCQMTGTGHSGTCTAYIAVGGACSPSQVGACTPESSCSVTTNTCVASCGGF